MRKTEKKRKMNSTNVLSYFILDAKKFDFEWKLGSMYLFIN